MVELGINVRPNIVTAGITIALRRFMIFLPRKQGSAASFEVAANVMVT